MKKIICENANKNKITFTYDFPFFLTTADGLYEKKGTVSTSSSAFGIGESYSGTSVKKRNIVITGIIKDDFQERREVLYNMFPLKTEGTLFYYENDISRKIKYIVEEVDVEEKGIPRSFMISLICPYPYFTDIEKSKVSMSSWTPLLHFPMISEQSVGFEFGTKNVTTMGTVTNNTNVEFGITIIFTANGNVKNPYLINVETQEKILINIEMKAGDEVIITTQKDDKNIIYIPDSAGIEENVNYLMEYGSKFLQMHVGNNTLRAGAEENENNLTTTVLYGIEYEAV